jgi:phage terminase large subunit-like protein
MTRDNPQRVLLGQVGEMGTGAIPKDCLGEFGRAMGVADLYDYIKVRHVSGGWSMLRFKYYAQGRSKWQGPPVDFVWFDEEPPEDIYSEGLARTIATRGMVALSFTPLLGMSDVVGRFLLKPNPDQSDTNMTIDDAEHIPVEERARIIASFPAHEREARARGIPTLGSGRIFPVPESQIVVQPFTIPSHWWRIKALDFGWQHPTACCWMAQDRDTDTIYVYRTYRRSEAPVAIHAAAINAVDPWIPVAWPHDGNNDVAAGPNLASQYRTASVNMLHEHAHYPKDIGSEKPTSTVSVEAGLQDMLSRMESGRWKVFANCEDWLEEYRLYHRKDGKIVKERDDLLSSSRYGLMMMRHAVQEKKPEPSWKDKLAKMKRNQGISAQAA